MCNERGVGTIGDSVNNKQMKSVMEVFFVFVYEKVIVCKVLLCRTRAIPSPAWNINYCCLCYLLFCFILYFEQWRKIGVVPVHWLKMKRKYGPFVVQIHAHIKWSVWFSKFACNKVHWPSICLHLDNSDCTELYSKCF